MNNCSCSNASSDFVTTECWTIQDRVDIVDGSITASVLLVLILIGLPWNALVLVTIIKEKLYQQPSVNLLLNLIVTDIAFLVLVVPLLIVTGFAGEFILGNSDKTRCWTCRFSFVTLTLLYNSLFTIGLMSLDRFFYIYKPLQYDRIVSKKWMIVPILLAWIFSLTIGATFLFIPGIENNKFQAVVLSCVSDINYIFVVVIIVIGFAVLVVIFITNVLIIRIVLKNLKLIYLKRKSTIGTTAEDLTRREIRTRINKTRHAKQLHLFRVFGALMLSYIFTWLPYISVLVALIVKNFETVPHTYITVSFILFYSQAVIHPMLQTVFIADVRRPLKKLIKNSIFCLKTSHNSSDLEDSHDTHCCKSCFFCMAISEAVLPQRSEN